MDSKNTQGRFLKKNVKKRNQTSQEVPKQPRQEKSPSKTVVTVFTALTLCVCIAACGLFLSKLGVSFSFRSKTIAGGVTVAGVDVGGLTRKQAEEAVTNAVGDSYSTDSMMVTVLDQQLEITPAVSGANLDISAAVSEAFQYGTAGNPAKDVDIIPYLNLNTEAIQSKINELAVHFPTDGTDGGYEIRRETVDGEEQAFLVVTIGSAYYNFDADSVYDAVLRAYNKHRFEATYACTQISENTIDLDGIYKEVCKEAVDASWDPDTHEVTEAVSGYRFDLDSAKEALAAAQPGDVLKFPFEEVFPEVSTESVTDGLFRDVLGTYTAKSASSYNRDTNLRLACEALDGTILYPGDVLDYNKVLGERTPEKGYKPAAVYMGSETVTSYGGGICQPSSALYYCALIADLEIVERHNHGFVSAYMPYGMDATVSWGGPEFKFRNSTNYPIRIDAEADGGNVTVTLMGTDEKDYYVEMEYEILSKTDYKTVVKEVSADSGHRDGEVETTPYTGYTVQTYKCKYDKETDELISREKEAYSNYSKRDKVVYKVKAEESTPTEPAPTDPPATEPPTTEPPTTEPPTTEPPTTEPPATEPIGEAGSDVELPSE